MYYSELPISAQTAYSQLVDCMMNAELIRSVSDLPGSFAAKTVKGKKYWYYQYTEPSGKLRQVYVGPDGDAVRSLIEKNSLPASSEQAPAFARSAEALGCTSILKKHFKVIHRLSDYGFFQAGGVLVGTHAFLAYSNMLGVRWGEKSQTLDIDFAHAGKSLALALPSNIKVETDKAIRSLEMGFLPVSGMVGKSGATYLNPREPEFRLDFLTTLHREGDAPFKHPQLNIMLQPLKFMEFSLEQVEQAVLFCDQGAVLINIPHPARYALHKLLVFGERSGSFVAKTGKDLLQAACLISFLLDNRPWELDDARDDLLSRGKGWVSRFNQGVKVLNQKYPEIEFK